MRIEVGRAAQMLLEHDDILILTHQSPDGDTLGCGFALYYALKQKGKRVQVLCPDEWPKKFDYLYKEYIEEDFIPKYVVAVDVADPKLLGRLCAQFDGNIALCMDHHPSNKLYAQYTLLDENTSAASEILYWVLKAMGTDMTPLIADCLYTGICTDSGCFKYSSVSAATHRIAADLMEAGAHAYAINRDMFDTKTHSRIAIESMALNTVQYFYGGRCAVIYISQQMLKESGADESDLDGVSSIPRQIEGVLCGITLREKEPNVYKISMRTDEPIDASKVCAKLGGGGHKRAAGCMVHAPLEEAIGQMVGALKEEFDN